MKSLIRRSCIVLLSGRRRNFVEIADVITVMISMGFIFHVRYIVFCGAAFVEVSPKVNTLYVHMTRFGVSFQFFNFIRCTVI